LAKVSICEQRSIAHICEVNAIDKTMNKITLVLGASENPERYSNKAIKALTKQGLQVIGIGLKKGKVESTVIITEQQIIEGVDTITIYLNAHNQLVYYDYILKLHPRRIIFNPGAENQELEKLAAAEGIICENACTLVLLSTNQY